jgi:hypothetical protein
LAVFVLGPVVSAGLVPSGLNELSVIVLRSAYWMMEVRSFFTAAILSVNHASVTL